MNTDLGPADLADIQRPRHRDSSPKGLKAQKQKQQEQ
jgi:hypothetical protein